MGTEIENKAIHDYCNIESQAWDNIVTSLLSEISSISRVNTIEFANRNIVLFQVQNQNSPSFYITIDDCVFLLLNCLESLNKQASASISELLVQNIDVLKLSDVDESFENDSLEVVDLKDLNNEFFDRLLIATVEKKAQNSEEVTIDFRNCARNDFENDSENRMFSKVDVSEMKKDKFNSFRRVDDFFKPTESNLLPRSDLLFDFPKQWPQRSIDSTFCSSSFYDADLNFSSNIKKEDDLLLFDDRSEDETSSNRKKINFNKKTNSSSSAQRPFICHFKNCNRAFKRFEHLKRHYRIHTGERPFKCKFPGCQKSFARSDNLNQHLKVHNSGMSYVGDHRKNSSRFNEKSL